MGKYHWHLVAGGGLSGYYIYTNEKVFTKEEIVELLASLEAENERFRQLLKGGHVVVNKGGTLNDQWLIEVKAALEADESQLS